MLAAIVHVYYGTLKCCHVGLEVFEGQKVQGCMQVHNSQLPPSLM